MTDQFNTIRREAEITSVEFADYCGMPRHYAYRLETGREIATPGIIAALLNMIAERAA